MGIQVLQGVLQNFFSFYFFLISQNLSNEYRNGYLLSRVISLCHFVISVPEYPLIFSMKSSKTHAFICCTSFLFCGFPRMPREANQKVERNFTLKVY
jgi:hypothetical protein